MALIKTSNEITSIRGRFGGVYFKTGKDGKHVQAMPRVWNYVRSPAQQGGWGGSSPFMSMGISGFSGASAFWLLALLAFYVGYWAAFALANYFTAKDGTKKHITGYNWYIYFALAFPETERPPFWIPPHSPSKLPEFLISWEHEKHYHQSPPEWAVDVCAGQYYTHVVYNGRMSYKGDRVDWLLWWKDPVWVISPGLGLEPPQLTYYSPDGIILATYTNPVTGKTASVYRGYMD